MRCRISARRVPALTPALCTSSILALTLFVPARVFRHDAAMGDDLGCTV